MTKQGFSSKGQILLWRIVNRKSVRRTITGSSRWSRSGQLVQGGRWSRTGICWCRKVFAGPELVVAGVCWWRKVIAGAGRRSLVQDGQLLVSAGAGKWPLVSAGAGRRSLVQDWQLLVQNW